MISRARRSPTKMGSHCVAPPAGTEPCSSPTCLMNAPSAITARSHAICSSLPPPTAIPLMRASVGLPISRNLSCMSLNAPNHFQYSRGFPRYSSDHDFRSAPTQNARPAPVTTTARTSSSHDASSHARAISRNILKSKAFSTSGRLSVIVARGGAFSYRIVSKPSSSGATGRGCVGSADVHELDVKGDALGLAVFDGSRHLLAAHASVEGVHVREFEFGVLRVLRVPGRRAEDAPRPERDTGHFLAELSMACVPIRVGRTVPQHHGLDHTSSFRTEC